MEIRTQWKKPKIKGEFNNSPSLTIPDMTLSIPELIKRYASGLSLGGSRVPVYDEDPENDILNGKPFASFDLSEQHKIINEVKKEYNETIQRLRNQQPSNSETIQAEQPHSAEKID